jgi:hypothetical protein
MPVACWTSRHSSSVGSTDLTAFHAAAGRLVELPQRSGDQRAVLFEYGDCVGQCCPDVDRHQVGKVARLGDGSTSSRGTAHRTSAFHPSRTPGSTGTRAAGRRTGRAGRRSPRGRPSGGPRRRRRAAAPRRRARGGRPGVAAAGRGIRAAAVAGGRLLQVAATTNGDQHGLPWAGRGLGMSGPVRVRGRVRVGVRLASRAHTCGLVRR